MQTAWPGSWESGILAQPGPEASRWAEKTWQGYCGGSSGDSLTCEKGSVCQQLVITEAAGTGAGREHLVVFPGAAGNQLPEQQLAVTVI